MRDVEEGRRRLTGYIPVTTACMYQLDSDD